jgi:hypothetical protein
MYTRIGARADSLFSILHERVRLVAAIKLELFYLKTLIGFVYSRTRLSVLIVSHCQFSSQSSFVNIALACGLVHIILIGTRHGAVDLQVPTPAVEAVVQEAVLSLIRTGKGSFANAFRSVCIRG